MKKAILINKRIHDNVNIIYDQKHIEIYNSNEQNRIAEAISFCVEKIDRNDNNEIMSLDFGAGTGNITKHLIDNHLNVTSADISELSLVRLKNKFDYPLLTTTKINGEDLKEFQSNTFDLVTTYSVLHHIPDYLKAVKELARVLKVGGILYIDHEVNPTYWKPSVQYKEYRKGLVKMSNKSIIGQIKSLFRLQEWRRRVYKFIIGPLTGVNEEGDIHVHPHDHIEWKKIEQVLDDFEIISNTDYLVCREEKPELWVKYKDEISDMRIMIAKKLK